jgi:hypothetical protein
MRIESTIIPRQVSKTSLKAKSARGPTKFERAINMVGITYLIISFNMYDG